MRWTTIVGIVTVVGLSLTLTACGEPSPEARDVQKQAGDTWDALKTWGAKKKEEFLKSAPEMLDALKAKFAAAKASAASAGSGAAKGLEDEWKVVEEKFQALKGLSGEQWEKAREAFVQSYEALSRKLTGTSEAGAAAPSTPTPPPSSETPKAPAAGDMPKAPPAEGPPKGP